MKSLGLLLFGLYIVVSSWRFNTRFVCISNRRVHFFGRKASLSNEAVSPKSFQKWQDSFLALFDRDSSQYNITPHSVFNEIEKHSSSFQISNSQQFKEFSQNLETVSSALITKDVPISDIISHLKTSISRYVSNLR